MADALTIKIGGRFNWRHQPERLVYMGRKLYPGDRRFWFQFALVDKPGECWSEVLESDLPMLEETADGVSASGSHPLPAQANDGGEHG